MCFAHANGARFCPGDHRFVQAVIRALGTALEGPRRAGRVPNMRVILRRLRRTSAREIAARGTDALRIATEAVRATVTHPHWRRDRLRIVPRSAEVARACRALEQQDWTTAESALRAHFLTRAPRFVIDPADRGRLTAAAEARFPGCVADARLRGDALLAGRYDLLGYRGLSFDSGRDSVDWHFDPVHGRRAPLRFWARVPYLDPACGDHKIVWELNRHQHWLALGRAAWLTGDTRFAKAAVAELESWLHANPPLIGINWSSMLEVAFRSISWLWALHLFVARDPEGGASWVVDLLTGLDRQLQHISRHLSTWFSPNTHLLGESLALYVAGRVLPELASAPRWERTGRAILLQEAHTQVHPDGGHAELSTHYHRYALDFYLLALVVARRTGDDAANALADVVARLAGFCRALADERGRLPTIGDDDGGLLFPMCGREPADVRDSLAVAAALLGRPELAVSEPPEEALWMLGGDADLLVQAHPLAPRSELFPDSGYAVLRSEREHAIVDVGHHGFLNGGHAHADALSIVLSIAGRPLLIDPGTATYTMNREQRDRFRSTAMHNTAVVNGRSQSEPAGPFHWASRAGAHVTFWRPAALGGAGRSTVELARANAPATPDPAVDFIEAEHDGYRPLLHRRGVLRIPQGPWLIADHLLGSGDHRIDLHWHVDPAWSWDGADRQLRMSNGVRAAIMSTAHALQVFRGDEDGLGWCAPVYGRVVPSTTIRMSHAGQAPLSIVTALAVSTSPLDLRIESAGVAVDRPDGWHRTAVVVSANTDVWLFALATPAVTSRPDVGANESAPTGSTPEAARMPHAAGTRRAGYRIACGAGELATDARLALLRFAAAGEPCSVVLMDVTVAAWTGRGGFRFRAAVAAQDVYLDAGALQHGDLCSAELQLREQ